MKTWAVVTSGPSPNSLGVVRALGRAGIPVALVDVVKDSPASLSRFVHTHVSCPGAMNDPRQLIESLLEFAAGKDEMPVLIPTGDRETWTVAQHREVVRKHYRLLCPEASVVQNLLDKSLFSQRLESVGLPHPKTQTASSPEELKELAGGQQAPFLLKPASSADFNERFGQKLFVIRDSLQLDKALFALREWPCKMMVQEWIPASFHHEVYALRTRQTGIQALSGWDRIRQFPPGFGSASYCRTARREEAIEIATAFLENVDYEGIAAIEFIGDSRDGRLKVIEANPRTTLQNRLAAAAGVDTEVLLYRILTGQHVERHLSYRENVYWIDNIKEGVSRILEIKSGRYGMRQILSDLMTRKTHSLLSWRDPLPVTASLAQAARRSVNWLKTYRMVR